jgi:soluble lytic murein transglycosylase-like protein
MKTALGASALLSLLLAGCVTPDAQTPAPAVEAKAPPRDPIGERVAYYAAAYDVPESLIDRSIQRESGFNPTARHGPYWGLMQIRLDTARSVGYRGPARGLLDADTNLKYGVAYLSNAYVVADRNPNRALALYSSGYFYEAKRKGLLDQLKTAQSAEPPPDITAAPPQ